MKPQTIRTLRGSLHSLIHVEATRLEQMKAYGDHKPLSYQSGLVDGLLIAASLLATAGAEADSREAVHENIK